MQLVKRTAFGPAEEFSVVHRENSPPTIATQPPISAALRSCRPFYCQVQRLFLLLAQHRHILSVCTAHAKKPVFNKRLHLWSVEGQGVGEICPHVLNLKSHWCLVINNGTGPRPEPSAFCLRSFPFHTSKMCVCCNKFTSVLVRMSGPYEKQAAEELAFI